MATARVHIPRPGMASTTATRARALQRSSTRSSSMLCHAPRVLVVGGGPVGLTVSYLLEQLYGVRTRVVERQLQPTTHPQAHFLNLRTMEVLHATMPGFHDRLLAQAAASELWRDYIYTTGIGKAHELARIDQFGMNIPRVDGPLRPHCEDGASTETQGSLVDALSSVSPTQFLHFPQNRFERMLATYLADHGMHVERGVEMVDLHVDAPVDGVAGHHQRPRVQLKHLATNQVEDASFDFVIGADGAHSLVRERCQIGMVGALNLQSIVNLHFTSKALSRAAREHPAMLYFIFNEHDIGVLIAHDLNRGEWVFQIPFFPPQESVAQDFSIAQCKTIVRRLLRQTQQPVYPSMSHDAEEDDIEILSVGQWRMSARVAEQYDHAQTVFLVGDAAHQFPPAGGLGMNTGIQDAHNLAWKLAWSIHQQQHPQHPQPQHAPSTTPLDPDTLLRSYASERRHIAKLNTQLSLRNVERTMKIPTALNVSHHNAQLLSSIVNAAPVKYLPLGLQRDAIQNVMRVGKMPLRLLEKSASQQEGSVLGQHMRRRVREIVDQRAGLAMLFYHFDIGFSYDATRWGPRARALMTEDALNVSAQFQVDAGVDAPLTEDAVFRPQFSVGVRFPHLWLHSVDDEESVGGGGPHRVSAVALADHVHRLQREATGSVRPRFVLVVDAEQWPHECVAIVEQLDAGELADQFAVVVVSTTHTTTESVRQSDPAFYHMRVDSGDGTATMWTQFTKAHAAALMRPDGHIGFLWGNEEPEHGRIALRQAMQHAIELS